MTPVTPVAPVAPLAPEPDAREADEALATLRRTRGQRRLERARAWLERWRDHPDAPEVRAVLREAPLAVLEHGGGARVIGLFLGDGQAAITGGADGTLRLWTASGDVWEEQRRWQAGGGVHTLVATPARDRVVLSVRGDAIRTLEPLVAGSRVHDLLSTKSHLSALAVGPDGVTVAAASDQVTDARYTTYLFDLNDPVLARTAGALRCPVRSVAFTRSGLLITGSGKEFRLDDPVAPEHVVTAWDLAAGEERWRLGLFTELRCVAVSPDERLVAAGSTSGQLLLIDIDGPDRGHAELHGEGAGRNLGGVAHSTAHLGGVQDLAFSPDGRLLYSVADLRDRSAQGELRTWSVAERREAHPAARCGHPIPSAGLDVSPDGRRLLISTRRDRVEVWSAGDD